MKILFVTPRFPYPPIKGDQAVLYHRIRSLSGRHRITLISLLENKNEEAHIEHLAPYCERIETVCLPRYRSMINVIARGPFSSTPLQVLYYASCSFREKVKELLARNDFDLIHVITIRVADYLSDFSGSPKILEAIDSMELNMRRRCETERGLKRIVSKNEWKRMAAFEREMCSSFDHVLVVSEVDRQAIGLDNVSVLPLGVDTDEFRPRDSLDKIPDSVIFSGNMGYYPNINAVEHFAHRVWPLVTEQCPQAKFLVVGANPPRQILQLGKKDSSIVVTGRVDSLSEYVNRARVAVAPILAGSGMQFKVLEAMACGVPVVASSNAVAAIEGVPGRHFLVTDDPVEFARMVVELLGKPELAHALSSNALELIEEKYTWERHVAKLEKVYRDLVNKNKGGKNKASADRRGHRSRPRRAAGSSLR